LRAGAPDSPQLAEQEAMRGMVALERDEPGRVERLLTDSVRIWRSRSEMDAHAADLCHLAQAQNELGRDEQADGNRRECLAALRGKAHPDPRSAVAALVHARTRRSIAATCRGAFLAGAIAGAAAGYACGEAGAGARGAGRGRCHRRDAAEKCWSDLPPTAAAAACAGRRRRCSPRRPAATGAWQEGLNLRALTLAKSKRPSPSTAASAAGWPSCPRPARPGVDVAAHKPVGPQLP
jgi:hypothetical protein